MGKRRIAIIGLGMMGGSLALALRNNPDCDCEIVGYARRAATAAEAVHLGAVDRAVTELREAVADAWLVVVATPVGAMEEMFGKLAPLLAPGTVVTDLGSTKVEVARAARLRLPCDAAFIGGHPMAGRAAAGIEWAKADLFAGTVFCVVVEDDTAAHARSALEDLAGWIGATTLAMTPLQHDRYVAGVSHLPMLLGSALLTTAASHEDWPAMSQLAAQGFREMTRIAAGSAEVRRSICRTNAQAIAWWIDRTIATLQRYRHAMLEDDEALLGLFEEARAARKHWIEGG